MNEDKRELGYVKRFLESMDFIPGYRIAFETDPKMNLQILGIPYAPEELQYYCNETGKHALHKDSPIDRYFKFVQRYKDIEINMLNNAIPKHPKLRKWRDEQILRCADSGLGERYYIPLAFELTSGCSVGCEFCGFSAKRLQQIYEYNPENIKLFESVLQTAMNVIGKAAAHGILYYATEPLDNPYYEEFTNVVFQMCGVLPQITTAVPLRNIERTKKLLCRLNQDANMFYRFSLLSLENLFEIHDYFNPEELLYTLLLPRFPEVSYGLVHSGRMAAKERRYSGSIACVTGFVINMCNKTISLRTPCNAEPEHPTGEIVIATSTFKDAEEFRYRLEEMIDRWMD